MDPHGLINEVFKEGFARTDLFEALVLLFNGVKFHQFTPQFMTLENITSVFKNKGSRMNLENYRRIFILTVLKKIMDKLIYFDNYYSIDSHMSDSNIGTRKDKNIRNHLFIIYGIINSVVKGKEECVDLQIDDIVEAFDSLWLEDTINDIYDTVSEEHRDD